ncbi:hypothetical protein IDJ75_19850 [Mucilaginibacter rigui]|uniref:Uncharacterized protein n=1 Tax=Mucilaginibacter rigui TaxID=534635 RepID=A0ABR7XAJ7_9SPHI|nr:hypothetical protein [Mucilaginibacter rigui]MBD1387549.1 hypothetical protein [Mucilaginibacter rigui]
MKKILLLLTLCAGTGTLMAQNTTIKPFDNTLNGKFTPNLKIDSSWRKLSNTQINGTLFKQEPADLKNLIDDKIQKSLFIASNADNMPVAKLNGNSKMPVVVLEGNSKMPVVGKTPKAQNNTVQVVP